MAELDGVAVDIAQLEALALVNYGHFTSMLVGRGRVRGLSLHLERLVGDCRRLFDADLDPDRVRYLVRRVVADAVASVVVRVTVFDPDLKLGRLGDDARPRILVTTRPLARGRSKGGKAVSPATPLPPPPGLRLRSVRYRRDLPEVKHVGLFGPLYLRREAQRAGFHDVVFTGADGALSEAATANLGFVRGEQVLWPRAEYLPGVTMRLIDQARSGATTTAVVTLADLPRLDAVFTTNATTGVTPVTAIDDVSWPTDHPVVQTLSDQYWAVPDEPL